MIKYIIKIETAGFILLALFQWIIEIFDIPSILTGMKPTPINYGESIIESIIVLLAGFFVVSSTRLIINRVKLLEGMLPICASCKKIRGKRQMAYYRGVSTQKLEPAADPFHMPGLR